MTLGELEKLLDKMGISPPDIRRASLYVAQIEAVHKHLTELKPRLKTHIQPALEAAPLGKLLSELCKTLDDFVVRAINLVLYDDSIREKNYKTFDEYFKKKIFNDNNEIYLGNVEAFFKQFPRTWHAIVKLAEDFKKNIALACTRVEKDWAALLGTFSVGDTIDDGFITQLKRIESSGSDRQKGGQRVLLLTFDAKVRYAKSDQLVDLKDYFRIVYKPSDVEVECLIAGKSNAVNAVHKNFQKSSLFEIVNAQIEKQAKTKVNLRPLPVYKILPFEWGSDLNKEKDGWPIRKSYGYIEFLRHEKTTLGRFTRGHGDFAFFPDHSKEFVKNTVADFYQIVGQLMAVATTFSLRDLCCDNVVVSGYKPHLIDLEICLTKASIPSSTTLLDKTMGGIPQSSKVYNEYWKESTSGKHLVYLKEGHLEDTHNRLRTTSPVSIVDIDTVALNRGFEDGMSVLAQCACDNAFKPWFERLTKGKGVIVRYLPAPTTEFNYVLMAIYGAGLDDKSEVEKTAREELKRHLYKRAETALDVGTDLEKRELLALREEHVLADYVNCDVPVFYHQVGTMDLLNSRGEVVTAPPELKIAKPNQKELTFTFDRTTFFPESPTAHTVLGQVVRLTERNNLQARIKECMEDIKKEIFQDVSKSVSEVLKSKQAV